MIKEGEPPRILTAMTKREPPTQEAEARAQAELQKIVRDLEAIRTRLMAIHGSLPVPPTEGMMLLGEEEMDVSMEIRVIIECVIDDSIRPAIRDLGTAAAYQPVVPEKGQET